MNVTNFLSGNKIKSDGFVYFLPELINHEWELTPELVNLESQASRYLGELNAYSTLVPNIDLYISMHIAKEADTSSKIEGTKTNIEDVFSDELDIDPEKKDDLKEVINYINATNYAIDELKNLPLATRLIKEIHFRLLSSVRGKHKNPGEFRKSQNWIGGSTLLDAHFVPPHHSHIQELLNDLEKFIYNKSLLVPDIIKIAIIHYQFETIHPFLDGNGRVGRLLIGLYLIDKGILSQPVLYLSEYFDRFRSLYYQNLDFPRRQNNMEQWLKFFLVAVIETSKKSVETFKKIVSLNIELELLINQNMIKKSSNGNRLLKFLYQSPVITPLSVSKKLNISLSTSKRMVEDFVRLKIITEKTGFKRNREFVFTKYLQLFETKFENQDNF
jgi:Fic family protein